MEASALPAQVLDLADSIRTHEGAPEKVRRVAKRHKIVSGRPTKLTVATAIRVLDSILRGNYRTTAVEAAGITRQTLRNWEARAKEYIDDPEVEVETLPPEEKVFVDFFVMLKVAEAQAEEALLRTAVRGAKGWQAAMTVLERRHPEMWGRSEKRIHEGGERPIVFAVETPIERQRRVAGILQESGALEGTARELPAGQPEQEHA